ncbi:MAG: hypothetical protein HC802_00280 [Caldilineaceae bacterium]|nr:hypothetical protein [Caldilineaceae bacterium]
MTSLELTTSSALDSIGLWVGLAISLTLLSLIVRDNPFARLAQHILVGAALGYAAILVVRQLLAPRLFAPLLEDPGANPWLLAPLVLGLLLWAAGGERLIRTRSTTGADGGWRRLLQMLGAAPVALMLGVTIGVGVTGALQGTLLPQFVYAADFGFDPLASGSQILVGLLTLLITSGALIHLFADAEGLVAQQPGWVRSALAAWLWLGKRGLWLAAGFVFARLMASRFSLLIGRVEYLMYTVSQSTLWQWAESIWQAFFG